MRKREDPRGMGLSGKPAAPKPRVLYVEDEDLNWEVAQLQLSEHYQLTRARSDAEACSIVKTSHSDFCAILMDIQLMGSTLDGIELTQLFKGHWNASKPLPSFARSCPLVEAPILFVSAYSLKYSEQSLKAIGGDALIPKPVNFVWLNLALASVNAKKSLSSLKG